CASRPRLPCRMTRAARPRRAPALLAGALLLAALAPAACGGRDAAEDAPAPPSTGIPVAPPNARGAPLDLAPPAASAPLPQPLRHAPYPPVAPEMPEDPAPAEGAPESGVQL